MYKNFNVSLIVTLSCIENQIVCMTIIFWFQNIDIIKRLFYANQMNWSRQVWCHYKMSFSSLASRWPNHRWDIRQKVFWLEPTSSPRRACGPFGRSTLRSPGSQIALSWCGLGVAVDMPEKKKMFNFYNLLYSCVIVILRKFSFRHSIWYSFTKKW